MSRREVNYPEGGPSRSVRELKWAARAWPPLFQFASGRVVSSRFDFERSRPRRWHRQAAF